MIKRSAVWLPTPKTVCARPRCRPHFVQVRTASCKLTQSTAAPSSATGSVSGLSRSTQTGIPIASRYCSLAPIAHQWIAAIADQNELIEAGMV